jgi:hypothetical protein
MVMIVLGASDVWAQEIDFVPVVVAQQELPRGFLLTEDNVLGEGAAVRIALYPADSLPASAIQSLEELIGSVLRTDVPPESPLVRHYLFPDPRLRPDAEVPFPISPPAMRVVRDYGAYREMTYENEGQFLLPARLAAGDTVDIVSSTSLGNPLQDESSILLENIVVARISDSTIAFSASEEDLAILSEYAELQVPMTLLIHSLAGDAESDDFNSDSNRINWEYLTTREDDPLVIPPGANMSSIGQ